MSILSTSPSRLQRVFSGALKPGLAALCVLGLLAGCAGAPPAPRLEPPVYPPPPDEARFIYERTLRINEDVEQLSGFARWRELATGRGEEVKGLVKPYGVAARGGRVYVTDTAQRAVLLFDIAGKRFLQFGQSEPGRLQKPIGIALSPDNEIYVADVSARRVQVYDADGKHLRVLGSDAELRRPSGVALSPDGQRLYVVDVGGVDSEQHHVQVFDPRSGALLQTIGTRGTGNGQFNLPLQAATAADGSLYVVDGGNFRVQGFAADGSFRLAFGEVGRFPGQFARPKGIATDAEGTIYVADAAFGNVQLFNPQGQILMYIGNRDESSKPGKFYLPAGVAVDETGRVYIADQYFRKIDIFRPVSRAPDDWATTAPTAPAR